MYSKLTYYAKKFQIAHTIPEGKLKCLSYAEIARGLEEVDFVKTEEVTRWITDKEVYSNYISDAVHNCSTTIENLELLYKMVVKVSDESTLSECLKKLAYRFFEQGLHEKATEILSSIK